MTAEVAARSFRRLGETFDLPSWAIHIARSLGCENQAFLIGASVIGMQFHLETTPESTRKIVTN